MKTIKDLMEDFRMGNLIEDADLVRFYKHISIIARKLKEN